VDVVVVNSDASLLLRIAGELMAAGSAARLFGIDILLGRPSGWRSRIRAAAARRLLQRVERFYLHQRDVEGLDACYGIGSRCEYVPFKSNVWERLQSGTLSPTDQGYVLHAGRTHRDLDCFLAAIRQQPVPTVLLLQPVSTTQHHGTTWTASDLPPWVDLVVDGDDRTSFDRYLAEARLVVIAIRPGTITPTGCSTLLDAMALGKCSIISDGPATRGIIDDQAAVVVPAGDSARLADAIGHFYAAERDRDHVATSARQCARQFQGADRLHRDLTVRIAQRVSENPAHD
jgi:glycosyltransferase involved in cell wall biosynthesis